MISKVLILAATVTAVVAQIPSFGGCPEYEPMANFEKEKFLGKWYEAERYFTVSEVGTRCVSVDYEIRPDGKLWVNNAYTNRITSVQRIVSGVVNGALKGPESILNVKYTSFPVNYDTTLRVLDTDYDSFAVIYSCTRIGPIGHTESAWLFTREREASGPTMQRAYGILDRYRISRTFFVKSDQLNCETMPAPVEAEQAKNVEPIPVVKSPENVEKVAEAVPEVRTPEKAVESAVKVQETPVVAPVVPEIKTQEKSVVPEVKVQEKPVEPETKTPEKLVEPEVEVKEKVVETETKVNEVKQRRFLGRH